MKTGASAIHDTSGSLLFTGMSLPSLTLGSRPPKLPEPEVRAKYAEQWLSEGADGVAVASVRTALGRSQVS